jgi:hypothetical protein
MGGLLIFALIGLYAWLAYVLVKRIPRSLGKTLLILAFVLIPSADAMYGRYQLKLLCEKEGGLKVYRTVENVDGVFADSLAPALVMEMNFDFSEEAIYGQIYRYRRPSGKLPMYAQPIKEKAEERKAAYTYFRNDIWLNKAFLKTTQMVKSDATSEILGTNTDFYYYGGWFEQFIGGLYGGGPTRVGHCTSDEGTTRAMKLIAAALKTNTKAEDAK